MEERVGYELKRTQQALRTAMDDVLGGLGLTAPQYAALAVLEDTSGISSAELARRCFVTAQTMSVIVAGLEGRGLLERRAHPTHGRILEACLTDRGSQLVGEAHEAVRAIEAAMTKDVTSEERVKLLELLRRCAAALERAAAKA